MAALIPLDQAPAKLSPGTAWGRFGTRLRATWRGALIDRGVFYGVLSRCWHLASAPITLLLIARYMTPDTQGFFYTFSSLLAIQSFFELGLYLVIVNFSSHEWAKLQLDERGRIVGQLHALSRLVSLGRLLFRWYAVVSAIFWISTSIVGYLFLSQTHTQLPWHGPWFALVTLSGLLLWMLPFSSILEGCNQVATVNQFRLIQGFFGTLIVWCVIILGGGLWAAPATVVASVVRDLYLIFIRYRSFFEPFLRSPTGPRINWRDEVWPMQWRLALSGLVNYFAFSLFSPVMFYYHGPAVAGRMGMTWVIVSGVQSVALMWVYARVPRFGVLIAQRNFSALDRFWLRTSLMSLGVVIVGAGAAWLVVLVLNVIGHSVAERLLPPVPTGLFLIAVVVAQIGQCLTAYLRAHRREPLLLMSVTSSLLIGLLVWVLGGRFGPIGAAAAYLGVTAGVMLPWGTRIWWRCRAAWHRA